jgi:hypothetical protein
MVKGVGIGGSVQAGCLRATCLHMLFSWLFTWPAGKQHEEYSWL